jgi:hypothetical protein
LESDTLQHATRLSRTNCVLPVCETYQKRRSSEGKTLALALAAHDRDNYVKLLMNPIMHIIHGSKHVFTVTFARIGAEPDRDRPQMDLDAIPAI